MNEEKNKIADQAIELIKPVLGVSEALSSDGILYFKGNEKVSTQERKSIISENIRFLKNNLEELEKLL